MLMGGANEVKRLFKKLYFFIINIDYKIII